MRGGGIGDGWGVCGAWGLVGGVGLLVGVVTSCVGANAGHCVYAGGDLACGTEICVLAPRGGTAPGAGDDGCFDGAEPPTGFLHAEFGLPARLEAEGDSMDLASVEGLLRRLADGDRSVSASDLESFRGAVFEDVQRIRGVLTREGGVREAERELSEGEEQAIEIYYDAVRAWLEQSPPGTGTESETETTGTAETETSGSTTSGGGCTRDEECTEAERPFCGPGGECVTCGELPDGDGACAAKDAGLGLCEGERCVECTMERPEACEGTTPVCEDATNTCVGCRSHAQCGEAACNFYTGACLPADAVAHVGPFWEFATLTDALASLGAEGTVVVHQDDYNEALVVDGGRVVAFVVKDLAQPRWILAGGGSPQLTVTEGATVLLEGLQVSGNADDVGLRVDGGFAWVERVRVVQNAGGGVVAANGADVTLRNCFVGGNGSGLAGSTGVDVNDASVRVLYTTIARNDETAIDSIRCVTGAVDVRNSIVVGRDANSIDCPGIVIADSALDEAVPGNTNVGAANATWFVNAVSDYHLTASGATTFADIAVWRTNDPVTDIDGDPRPRVDDTPDHAGADVP